jgi:hypothetical protein
MHSAGTASLNTNGDRASPALTDKAAKATQKVNFFTLFSLKLLLPLNKLFTNIIILKN